MAGSVNKVILIGNLGADPEIRTVTAGTEVCNLRLATSRSWSDNETGDKKESTQWHSVTIWDVNAINYAKNYLSKGSQVFIEGKLETRKWQDQSGQDRFTTEVVLRPYRSELTMLDSRGEGGGGGQGGGYAGNQDGGGQGGYMADPNQGGNQSGGYSSPTLSAELDDEIPF